MLRRSRISTKHGAKRLFQKREEKTAMQGKEKGTQLFSYILGLIKSCVLLCRKPTFLGQLLTYNAM